MRFRGSRLRSAPSSAIRVSCAECMVAHGSDEQLATAALIVALIDHEVWEFWVVWGYEPDLGLLDERLDLLRARLEERSGPL